MEQRFLYKSYFVFCILMRPAITFFVKKKFSLLYPDWYLSPACIFSTNFPRETAPLPTPTCGSGDTAPPSRLPLSALRASVKHSASYLGVPALWIRARGEHGSLLLVKSSFSKGLLRWQKWALSIPYVYNAFSSFNVNIWALKTVAFGSHFDVYQCMPVSNSSPSRPTWLNTKTGYTHRGIN